MKKKILKVLAIVLPLAVGLALIWYSFNSASVEDRQILWKHITNANPWWIFVSLALGMSSHISRAYRWKYLVAPMGYKPRLSISTMALMMGYLINYGIPRSGEILRAATLSNYEGVPFQKSMGTIITERVVDLIMLLLIIVFAFILNTQILLDYFSNVNIKTTTLLYSLTGLILVTGIGYIIIKKLKFPFIDKVKKFLAEIYEGMLSIFKMENKWLFIIHSFYIWIAYLFMFYCVKFCTPATETITFSAALMAFIAGSFAMTTTNGGIGAFPVAVGLVLLVFNISKPTGEAYGWIIWGSQTLLNIVVGGASFLILPLFSKRK